MTAPARPLPDLLETLRGHGLRRGVVAEGGQAAVRGSVPSGHPSLDRALATGGWPRGTLAVLDGLPGSGGTSLALSSLAACQASGGLGAWIDGEGCFDPSVAAGLGVRLDWLLVVRPADAGEALELAAWLARSRLIDLLVLDLDCLPAAGPPRAAPLHAALSAVDRLPPLLARTGSVALTLASSRLRRAVSGAAGVRVALERRAWLAVGRDLVGQRVEATVTRHRHAPPGGRAELDLWFAEGRRIDPLLLARARPVTADRAGVRHDGVALDVLSA